MHTPWAYNELLWDQLRGVRAPSSGGAQSSSAGLGPGRSDNASPPPEVEPIKGDTSVLAGLYGPAEVKVSKELYDKATVEVLLKPKVGLPGVFEKNREQLIRKTCEAVILGALHPRTSISIVLQVISDAGAVSFTGSPAGGALQRGPPCSSGLSPTELLPVASRGSSAVAVAVLGIGLPSGTGLGLPARLNPPGGWQPGVPSPPALLVPSLPTRTPLPRPRPSPPPRPRRWDPGLRGSRGERGRPQHGLSPRSGVARQFTVPLPWQEARAVLTFAISSVEQQVLMSTSKGTCSVEELQRCIAAAQRASGAIFQFYRDSVRRKYSKA
nr:exosome complex component RRP46 [Chrysemys picta bellii]